MTRDELDKIYSGVQSNDSQSIYQLGKLFVDENGIEKIPSVAVKRYAEAARLGHSEAKGELLGIMKNNPTLLNGVIDEAELLALCNGDENLDGKSTMILAGMMSRNSDATAGEVNQYLEKAAMQGDPEALCRKGFAELYGKDPAAPGVKDYAKAYEHLMVAKDADIPMAYFCLANMYINGLGVEKNVKEGKTLLEKASEKGITTASIMLGNFYMYGGQYTTQDYQLAMTRYKRALAKDKRVLGNLAEACSHIKGSYNSIEEAISYAKQANNPPTKQGSIRLAEIALRTERYDEIEPALSSLLSAGDGDAEYFMGFLYANGISVAEDHKVAKQWLNKAIAHGNALAGSLIAELD